MSTQQNPFPGPRPYERKERNLFFGRDELANRLFDHVLAKPCTLLYGPSGAGKSSLVQAAVFPRLEDEPSLYRVLSLDRWAAGDDPLHAVVEAMYAEFDLGDPPETPNTQSLSDAVDLAFQVSDRPLLLSFDQIEQLLYPGRDVQAAMALFDALDRMVRTRLRGIAVVLGIREDYLGLLRDRLQGRRVLLDHGFRVGPMVVQEMVSAVCMAAEKNGRTWDVERMRSLVLQMRERTFVEGDGPKGRAKDVEDNDEVQAAFVQIVCRAKWESGREDQNAQDIVAKYLEDKLAGVGQAERRLLEDHLIDASGHRTMLTLQQAKGLIDPERAVALLQNLEKAAIVRGEEYRGGRRYELGHDWLAQRLRELRAEREKAEEERRAQERLSHAKKAQRRAYTIAAVAMVAVIVIGGLALWARQQRELARTRAIMAGAREHLAKHENHWAAKLLLEIKDPEHTREWASLAGQVLDEHMRYRALAVGANENVKVAEWSPDNTRVLVVTDKQIRIERIYGNEGRWELKPGRDIATVTSAAWSPGGSRVAIADKHGVYLWYIKDGTLIPLRGVDEPQEGVYRVVWGDDDRLLVWNAGMFALWNMKESRRAVWTPVRDGSAHWAGFIRGKGKVLIQDSKNILAFHSVDGSEDVIELGETDRLREWNFYTPFDRKSAAVGNDGEWLLTSRNDFEGGDRRVAINLWRTDGLLEPQQPEVPDHWQIFGGTGNWLLGTDRYGSDFTMWNLDEQGAVAVMEIADGGVSEAAMSPTGTWVALANYDDSIELWHDDRLRNRKYNRHATFALRRRDSSNLISRLSFALDEEALLVQSVKDIEVWPVESNQEPKILRANVRSAILEWDPNGNPRVTSADKPSEPNYTPTREKRGFDVQSPDGKWIASMQPPRWALQLTRKTRDGRMQEFHSTYRYDPLKLEFSPDGTRVAAVYETGNVYIWTISIPALQKRLRDANIDCLPPDLRQLHLDESETEAKAHYDECERGYGRIPFEAAPFTPQPQSSAHP